MRPVLRRGFTIFVMVVILIPVTYMVVIHTNAITGEADPLSFVPVNSSTVISVKDGNGQLIIFSSNSESGYVFHEYPGFLYRLIKNHNLNVLPNVTFSQVTEFRGIPLYELSNLPILSLVANTSLRNALDKLNVTNSTLNGAGTAIYFANPDKNIFVMGSPVTVRSAISQAGVAKTINPLHSMINSSADISFIIRSPVPGYIQQITGNLTGDSFSIAVRFSQSIYAADFFALYLLSLLGKGIVIVPLDIYTDEVIVNLNYIEFLPVFSLIQNAFGGI